MNNKLTIIILILLALLGQNITAAVISCHLDKPMGGEMSNQMVITEQSKVISHSGHQMVAEASSVMNEDCCTQLDNCSTSGCALFAIPNLLTSLETSISQQMIPLPANLAQTQTVSSVFRPPIPN